MRGNVVDLAVGVIIGAAFTAVVNSLVRNIFTPIIGVFGGTDFKDLTRLSEEAVLLTEIRDILNAGANET